MLHKRRLWPINVADYNSIVKKRKKWASPSSFLSYIHQQGHGTVFGDEKMAMNLRTKPDTGSAKVHQSGDFRKLECTAENAVTIPSVTE